MSSASTTPLPMSDTEYFESTRPSSVATTPPGDDSDFVDGLTREERDLLRVEVVDREHLPEKVKYLEDMDAQERWKQLDILLEKSAKYSAILHEQMSLVKAKSKLAKAATSAGRGRPPPRGRGRGRGRPPTKRLKTRVESDTEVAVEAVDTMTKEEKTEEKESFQQPALVSGGTLKDYQLEGVAWMASLWENGISGILADEMGLGKTIQTISFCAFLRERTSTPFLIVCPLSVLHNWIDEFNKFAPEIPVVMYHGTPEHRADLRRSVMHPPSSNDDDEDPAEKPPVVVTTYEIIIRDRKALEKYTWAFIVVDEGHRLKNMNCKLMQEIKKYKSGGRMVLTGTPLHNNLAELWSLLNFVLPDIFSDLDTFQQWFNIPTLSSQLTSEQTHKLVATLHSVLKPFLLRRLKVDVEYDLPPKKEYVLYAPLTEKQKSVYEAVVNGSLRRFLIEGKQQISEEEKQAERERKRRERERLLSEGRKLRGVKRVCYDVDGSDGKYFRKMESGELDEMPGYARMKPRVEDSALEIGKQYHRRKAVKQVNNLHLQNAVMQLRKVCSHPFLFDWPIDLKTGEEVINEELVDASGKMLVLDRLLTELFKRGHKVLLFSQFTTMLDIIEAWATEFKGWNLCRIDGSYGPATRREEMRRFQEGGDDPDAPRLFILSTRAGGLGINLTAADTVVFYDQDWNPQMDMQAQDRCHRIGQTKPVLIFRLVTAHTIEDTIMRRATEKRKLEALVIAKGKFKVPGSLVSKNVRDKDSLAELAASLLKLEGEKIDVVPNTEAGKPEVLSDKDLDILLDRSPEVFADRVKGWTSADAVAKAEMKEGEEMEVDGKEKAKAKAKAAFAVYEAAVNDGNDALANMLGEGDGEESDDVVEEVAAP